MMAYEILCNRENARNAWKKEMIGLAEKGDFAGVLRLMARNCGDRGDVFSLIDNFAENADPLEMEL